MFTLHALEASEPLTKTLSIDPKTGLITKGNYPNVLRFTSHDYEVDTIADFYRVVTDAASKGWCLLKGKLHRQLINESRAGSTKSEDETHWICLDLDGLNFPSIEDFMSSHHELKDVAYIVQYSSSSGLATTKGLHAHVFILLSHPYHATYLKGWLTKQNVDGSLFGGKLVEQLTLTRTYSALHYPIDITACQNDKLLYIAPPIIQKGVKFDLPDGGFIQLVKEGKKLNKLPIERLGNINPEFWKDEARKRFNALRQKENLPVVTKKPTIDKASGFTVEPDCGAFIITGIKDEPHRGFRYFNMNGGDSWSWYHPLGNHRLIHCFKDDKTYLTERICPEYYREQEALKRQAQEAPREDGLILLAFRDLRSAAYFNGTWNPNTQELMLHQARSELQLDHFLKQHGRPDGLGDFIPQWNMEFNPRNQTVCDPDDMYINTYVPSPYFRMGRNPARNLDSCPIIERIILSAVSGSEWNESTEHFLNWLAVIFQHKVKTRTAWVLHGTEGTGKGLIAEKILIPLLGERYVQQRRMSELEEKYTGWMEEALIAVIDEVQVSASARKSLITSDLKNWIPNTYLTMRSMNRMSYQVENFTNFMLYSNMPDMVVIDASDRRYNVGVYQGNKLNISEAEIARIEDELPFFMDYIMQRDADIERAGQILRNQAHTDIITANKNTLDMLCEAIHDGDMTPFLDALPDTQLLNDVSAGAQAALGSQYSRIVLRELEKLTSQQMPDKDGFYHMQSRLTRDEVSVLLRFCVGENIPTGSAKFTRMLKHKRLELKQMRINGGNPVIGLEVNWVASHQWIEDNKREAPQPKMSLIKGTKT